MTFTKSEILTEEKKKMLNEYYSMLTLQVDGAVAKIAEKCDYSRAYIYRFFKGDYNITHENQKILDIGIELIEDELKSGSLQKNEDQVKENDLLTKKLQEAKNLKPLADEDF